MQIILSPVMRKLIEDGAGKYKFPKMCTFQSHLNAITGEYR